MLQRKKRWVLGLMTGALALAMAFPGYGAKGREIKSIRFSVKAHIVPDTEFGEEEIELETGSKRFSIDGYEILNEGFLWEKDSVPRLRVTMTANDNDYFSVLSRDKVIIKGGGEFVKATRQDSNSTLLLEIRLPAVNRKLGEIGKVALSDDGMASWDAVESAGSYEVKVYRDGTSVGAVMGTRENRLDCSQKMTKGNASYTVKVRPISKYDENEKGQWIQSSSVSVDQERASQFRDNLEENREGWVWLEEKSRWRYDSSEGAYLANGWYEIGGKWYFFNQEGYMETGWIQWEGREYYCRENGEMLSDCMTPDNYWVGKDGAKIDL